MADSHQLAIECRRFVDELYAYRDNYFVDKSGEPATFNREADLKLKLKEVLEKLEANEGKLTGRDRSYVYSFVKGKALNVFTDFSKEAFELLSKAVKLNPSQTEAWNQLGECFWKQGEIESALNCFEGAINHDKTDSESLRNLSVVLRQVGKTPEERAVNLIRSVDVAHEAVKNNVSDGKNWAILGNAYLIAFGRSARLDYSHLEKCKSAYARARSDKIASSQSDFLYNYSNLLVYEEKYQEALDTLKLASEMDPSWDDLKVWRENILKSLLNTSDMVSKRASMKPKRLQKLMSDLGNQLNSLSDDEMGGQLQASELIEGCNNSSWIAFTVIGCISHDKEVCRTVCGVDSSHNSLAITLYNVGKEPKIGDVFVIKNPVYSVIRVNCDDKVISFPSIRVNDPLLTKLNGKSYPKEYLARPKVENIIKC
ncbi:Tetratricopeptide repeat protein 5 [Halotydeus destructor]|nr:Tetratricopeptide repeat protein 5 [Halotydeus destructor]